MKMFISSAAAAPLLTLVACCNIHQGATISEMVVPVNMSGLRVQEKEGHDDSFMITYCECVSSDRRVANMLSKYCFILL